MGYTKRLTTELTTKEYFGILKDEMTYANKVLHELREILQY